MSRYLGGGVLVLALAWPPLAPAQDLAAWLGSIQQHVSAWRVHIKQGVLSADKTSRAAQAAGDALASVDQSLRVSGRLAHAVRDYGLPGGVAPGSTCLAVTSAGELIQAEQLAQAHGMAWMQHHAAARSASHTVEAHAWLAAHRAQFCSSAEAQAGFCAQASPRPAATTSYASLADGAAGVDQHATVRHYVRAVTGWAPQEHGPCTSFDCPTQARIMRHVALSSLISLGFYEQVAQRVVRSNPEKSPAAGPQGEIR